MGRPRDLGDSASVINILDGATAGTIVNSKAVAYGSSGEVNATTLQLSGTAISATAAEINLLDGVTATTAELNYVDGVTSNIQTQLDNISVTGGTLTKTFLAGEQATITLTSGVLVPNVTVTKEVSQTGSTNNNWLVNSSSENYTRYNSAAATTLTFNIYDVSTASFVDSFSVNSQDDNPTGLAFSADGTKMFVTGRTNDKVFEYALSTAFDVSTSSYTQSFSVSSQASQPAGLAFNTDGTKMFVTDFDGNDVNEYALTTGFDVSTASYTQNFSVNSQETDPHDIAFNNDGTKMFIVGYSSDAVNEYALSTGFDISTASYTRNFSVSSQEISPRGLAFNSDGTKMFVVGTVGDDVNEYALTTGFDVSTASYTQNFDVSGQDTAPKSIRFNTDGTKMFILGDTGDDINEYTLSLGKVILGSGTFASADVGKVIEANSGVFLLTSTAGAVTQLTAPTSFSQVASGSWQLYGLKFNTTDGDLELSGRVLTANLSSPSQVASLNLSTGGANINTPSGIFINSAGTRLFVTDDGPNDIIQLNLSTAFDITTGSYSSKYLGVGSRDGNPNGIWFKPDGSKMFFVGKSNQKVFEYTASSGNEFEINQYSYANDFSVSSQSGDPKGVVFNPTGTTMIIVDDDDNALYQYTLSTGFALSSASYASKSFSVSSQVSSASSIAINSDGTKIFINDFSSETVFEYELTTGFDISTMSYTNRSYAMSGQMSTSRHLFLLPDDESFISGENASSMIYEYSCSSSSVPSGYHAAHTTVSTDSTYWTDINSMTASESAGNGNVYYCVSTDDRTTWKVARGTEGERSIVRNNSGTWQYNSNGTYGSTTWANASVNAELYALQEAMTGAAGGYSLANLSFVDSFSVSSQESAVAGVAFNTDGTKMFISGYNGVEVNEYALSTGFDVSTASYTRNYDVSSQVAYPYGITFNNDGTKMFLTDAGSGDDVNEYALSTGFDISTASYTRNFSVGSQDTSPRDIKFNSNGTKMFVVGKTGSDVNEYTLSTGFDISTASFVDSFSVSSQDANPHGLAFNSDGTKMFVSGYTNDAIYEYALTTGFDVSTASFVTSASVSSQDTTPQSLAFSSDGTKLFVVGAAGADINEYNSPLQQNQMNKTQLDAIPDANHFTLGNDLDLAIIFNMSSGTTLPSSDGVAINYDAAVLNQGAILGTDYNFDAPATNKVRITAVNAGNLKVRVV